MAVLNASLNIEVQQSRVAGNAQIFVLCIEHSFTDAVDEAATGRSEMLSVRTHDAVDPFAIGVATGISGRLSDASSFISRQRHSATSA